MLSLSLPLPVVKVCRPAPGSKWLRTDAGIELLMWTLVENYTHMDLAVIAELNIDVCLAALQLNPPTYSALSPGELSYGGALLAQFAIY
jgi:hypothetical protein